MQSDVYVAMIAAAIAASAILVITLLVMMRRLRQLRERVSVLQSGFADMETAYANAPLGLATLDAELRYVRINKLLAQINGVSVEAHIGKSIHEVVPNIASQVQQPFMQVLRTGEPVLGLVIEGMTDAQPGIPRFWRENVYPIFSDGGKIAGIHVTVEDFTEEKRLNDALRASEQREHQRAKELEVVMNAAPAAVFLSHDAACRYVSGNPEGNRMLRLHPGDNASANPPDGESPFRFWSYPDGAPVSPEQLPMQVAAATGREVRDVELTVQFKDGDAIHVQVNAAPLRNEKGELAGAVCAFIDVTAQKRAEQTLMRESERKDEFLATLAHELRSPLAAIHAGLEVMKLASSEPPALAQARTAMERQVLHLVRLIDDLLDVSRVSYGKLKLKKEKVSVQDIIDSAVEVSRPQAGRSGHVVDMDVPAAPLYVEADRVRMAQVVSNLLNNAAKYTPEGGHIRVQAAREGSDAVIRVIDNGIGIEKDMLDKVFDLFSQAESASEHRKGGIGVGLALARQLVDIHGGTLIAQSDGPGTGSTFTARLPLLAGADGGTDPVHHTDSTGMAPMDGLLTESPSTARGRRILIVDDNQDAAQMLAALLELGGHTVRLAYSGRSALDVARAFQPELAFLDIGMPDMSGHDVAKAMRNDSGIMRATLVALTGWGSDRGRAESRDAGFDYHLTKPVSLDAIRCILPDLKLPQIA
ncbi:hypothetical protein GCM10027343_16090 [Noviherbaspirillum agri]